MRAAARPVAPQSLAYGEKSGVCNEVCHTQDAPAHGISVIFPGVTGHAWPVTRRVWAPLRITR